MSIVEREIESNLLIVPFVHKGKKKRKSYIGRARNFPPDYVACIKTQKRKQQQQEPIREKIKSKRKAQNKQKGKCGGNEECKISFGVL